jgi:hypothetical protein
MDLKLRLNRAAFYALAVKRIKIKVTEQRCKIVRESPTLGHFKLRVTFPLGNLSKHSLRQWNKEGGEQFDRQAIA